MNAGMKKNLDRATARVLQIRQLIADSTTSEEAKWHVVYAQGFLTGYADSGFITYADRDTYMQDLYKFLKVRCNLFEE